jgi:hypothetical protein
MHSVKRLARSILIAASALAAGSAMAAPTFAITGPSSITQGSTFTLAISATDVADLYAWQLDIAFNPVLFRAGGVTEGSFLKTGGSTYFDGGVADNAAGTISFAFDTLLGSGPGVSGSGTLAILSFTSIANSNTYGNFAISDVSALNSSLASMTVATRALDVQVTPVPEPETWGLMLAGLVGIAAVGRRRASRMASAA